MLSRLVVKKDRQQNGFLTELQGRQRSALWEMEEKKTNKQNKWLYRSSSRIQILDIDTNCFLRAFFSLSLSFWSGSVLVVDPIPAEPQSSYGLRDGLSLSDAPNMARKHGASP